MWSRNDLKEDIKTLEEILKKEKDLKTKEYYSNVISSIYEFISYLGNFDFFNGYDSYNDALKECSCYSLYYPYVEKYNNIFLKSNVNEDFKYYNMNYKLKEKDLLDIVDMFYKSFDSFIYKNFKTVLDNAKINYVKSNELIDGQFFNIPVLNKNYIEISKNKDLRCVIISLIHEFGHGIVLNMNKDRYYNDTFMEIESYFFELLGYDFLRKTFNDKFYSEEKKKLSFYNCELSCGVINTKNLVSKLFNYNSKEALKVFAKKTSEDENYSNSVSIDVEYLIGYIVAIELYENYLINKDNALNKLINITSNSKNESEYERILKNVSPCKSLSKYLKKIKNI